MTNEIELDTKEVFKGAELIMRVRHPRSMRLRFWLVGRLLSAVRLLLGAKSMLVADWFCDCGKCGHACAYVEPYGFVPEAGCSTHDVDD